MQEYCCHPYPAKETRHREAKSPRQGHTGSWRARTQTWLVRLQRVSASQSVRLWTDCDHLSPKGLECHQLISGGLWKLSWLGLWIWPRGSLGAQEHKTGA